MPQSRVKKHKAVKIRIVRLEVLRAVHIVVVVRVRRDLDQTSQLIFHHAAMRVAPRAVWQGEFGFPTHHGFRADEDDVDGCTGEEVGELIPDGAREGGFGAGTEDEEPDRGGFKADAFD